MSSPWSEPFWDAAAEHRMVLQWCRACDAVIQYPRPVCPTCLGEDLEWRPSDGVGEVYSHTVVHKGRHPVLETPYVVALVLLDEGARLMTNVVGCDPADVKVGMRVKVAWQAPSEEGGRTLPWFEPA